MGSTTNAKLWGKNEFWGLDSSLDPDWLLTKEQKDLRDRLIEVCRTIIRPEVIRSDKTYDFPSQSIKELGKLGLLGLIVPKELGGRGENHVCVSMIIETITRYGGTSLGLIYGMHIIAVSALAMYYKGNDLITDFLKKLDKEALLGTVSTSDPSTGGHFWFTPTSKIEELSENEIRALKFASWCTSSGFADFYVCQTASPKCKGNYSEGSCLLVFKNEIRATTDEWAAMGVRGNQSGPMVFDEVLKKDRVIGRFGVNPELNGEAVFPFFSLCMSSVWNGLSMGALDISKKHLTRKAHGDVGVKIAEYPIIQDTIARCIASTCSSRLSTFSVAAAMDEATNNCDWSLTIGKPEAKLRAQFGIWYYIIKHNSSENAAKMTDKCLKCCGGEGYKEELGLERLVRDSKAGMLMAPSNEFSRSVIGKIALLGSESVDYWERNAKIQTVQHEVQKMTTEQKRKLMEKLAQEIYNEENGIVLKHPNQDEYFDNPFNTSNPKYLHEMPAADGLKHAAALHPQKWLPLKLVSRKAVNDSMTSFTFGFPGSTDISGCLPGQYVQMKVMIGGKEQIRSYSPVSCTDDFGKIELVLRFESQGIISEFFRNLKPGDSVEFRGPCGGFEYEPNKVDQLTIMAAGAGVTPAIQLIRTVVKDLSDKTNINLLYYSESLDKMLFHEELKKYTETDPRIKIIFTLGDVPDHWDGYEGFIDGIMIQKYVPAINGIKHKILMCGGATMTTSCLHSLKELGYPPQMMFLYGQFGTDQMRIIYGQNIRLSSHNLD